MQDQAANYPIIPDHILWQSVESIWSKAQDVIKPKPLVTVSEWADTERYLSAEDSKKALLGDPKWSHEGFEYLKGFQDAFNDPLIRRISVMKSGQTGFTQGMLNMIGWSINHAPGPMLVLYPIEGSAKKFVKRKLDPMIRDTPSLREKISDAVKRDGNNSTFEKTYPGGFASILSAASVNNLAQQSIMYLLIDEFDRIARTAGQEGDTIDIIRKRLQGFYEVSKEVDISTPTLSSSSKIAIEYDLSNKQKYYVPCTHCGEAQVLKWAQIKGWHKGKGVYVPEEAYYECEICKHELYEKDKYIMVKYGNWIPEKPQIISHAGFWINELYSTLSTWQYVVEQFIPAKENPFKLQVFVNTVLGETFEDNIVEIPANALMARAENYDASLLPEGVLLIDCATDLQGDRAEVTTVGFGLGEECWVIEHQIFYGDPEKVYDPSEEKNLYYRLEQYYETKFLHASGMYLRIQAAGIDTGYATTTAQKFIKKMNRLGKNHIFALQGDKGKEGAPLLNRGSVNNKSRVKQFTIGTYTAKNIIYARLQIDEFGPGYIHFPNTLDEEWYKQLTAEKKRPVYEKGVKVREEYKKIRARNEALDNMGYALAGLDFLNVNLTAVHRNFNAKLERMKEEERETRNEKSETEDKLVTLSASFRAETRDDKDNEQDFRNFRRPKKKLKLKRQNNFATNY